ncbi:hypothetical protein E4T02_14525 [Listeria monocytogenes]|nr:hypothetical protein [Listeria monocytogenes]UCK61653.1 hypothetical protein pLIS47_00111c [Listeria ivanovii]UCK61778.1 hypothetical protein pLIS50_00111c [Listeria seeligeri]EAE3749714.1 hypothetical protein [Listeria monocytogenes]EAE5773705.1 hypothetical protein [Listeria monocytogenes]
MTHIISAFPCMGKTTIFSLNKDTMFDREFNESRSIRGMSTEERDVFFQQCANMVQLQQKTGYYDYIFITDNPSLVSRLDSQTITHVYPNVFDEEVMQEYKQRILERNDIAWYERVITPKLSYLKGHIVELQEKGCDVRLTDLDNRFIEDVFTFNAHTKLPK